MGLLSGLLGGAAGGAAGSIIKDTASGIGGLAKDIRTAITGIDPAAQAEIEKATLAMEQAVLQAQADINKIEAGSASMFVAGWRPFLGWLFGCIMALHYAIRPIAQWIVTAAGSPVMLPDFDLTAIWPVLIGLLGLGTLRTVEKIQGATSNH